MFRNLQEFLAYLKLVLPFLCIGKDKQAYVMAYRHPAALALGVLGNNLKTVVHLFKSV